MSKCNENRQGYKKTPVGWIPEEWNVSLINTLGEVITGTTPSKNELSNYGDSIPWCTAIDMQGKYVVDTSIKLSKEGAKKARVLPQGAVLITCIASIGKNSIAKVPLATNQQINAIIVNSNNHNEFIYYALSQKENELKRIAGKTAVPIIPKSVFSKFKIATPCLNEQVQISKVISLWECSIEKIQQFISTQLRSKKNLIQKLVTGRIRFPEFGKPTLYKNEMPHEWKVVQIKDIAQVYFSGIDKKSHPDELNIKLCNYLDVYKNEYITADLNFMEATASVAECKAFQLKKGDVIITKDSETPDDIGIPAIVIDQIPNVLCGYHLALIRPDISKINSIYLSKVLSSNQIKNHFLKQANGATRFGLSNSTVKNTVICLPSIEEQNKIGAFLFTIDNEISLLRNEVKLMTNQKKGLMQKLLTGEVRHPDFIKKQITKEATK